MDGITKKDAIINTKHANESTQKIQTIEEGIKELKEAMIEINQKCNKNKLRHKRKNPHPKTGKHSKKNTMAYA